MTAVPQAYELALQYHRAGRLAEAEALYRQILTVQPNHADACEHLGVVAQQTGRYDLAVASILRAIALDPQNATAHSNLGEAYRATGRLEEAIASYRRAIELNPDFPEAHSNLGIGLWTVGRFEESLASCHRALELRPDYPEAHLNLGNALLAMSRPDEAITAFRGALVLSPASFRIHNNLASAFAEQGRVDEAVAAYRRLLEVAPWDAGAHSNLIRTLHYLPTGSTSLIAAEQERWNQRSGGAASQHLPKDYRNIRNPGRRLRIGYVSPDFWDHVVGRYLLPLWQHHDHERFEIVCYSGVTQPDAMTEVFRQHSDGWRHCVGVRDDALAAMILRDEIDILVDLSQHTGGNRLPVFARRPAPVQVSFGGYPESTGLEAIEYRISDRWLEGNAECGMRSAESGFRIPNSEFRISERVILIDTFWCYDPGGMEIEAGALPANENGFITFGSLNSFCKINEPVLRLWARVLEQVRNSRLILLSSFGSHRQRTLEFLAREGVAENRVEFVERRPRKMYLERHHRLDIALDPFPYGGHTTSLDALWMGVPVTSLAGKPAVSRAGLSILGNLGLREWVADTEDEYVRIATELSRDLPRLAHWRATLRNRMASSVLMDAPRYARQIEGAYRSMWQEWCTKVPPP